MFALLLPLLAFVIAYPLWHLSERDLFWNEGDYATIATEFDSFPPVVTAHGQIVNDEYPLYPLLVRGLSECGLGMEFSLRFISLSSLFGLVIIIWITCYRAAGLQAASAASAMMLSTVLVAEKSIEGYPQMLTVLLIFSGWLLWYNFGQRRSNWDMAWIVAGLFAGLSFYNGGWLALIYFLVPLAFQRRPLTIWSKINRWGFITGTLIVLAFILFWGLPYWFEAVEDAGGARNISRIFDIKGTLENILVFPLDVLLRFMPWTLFLWAPFCAALIPLDKNPLFSKFLRILTYATFALVWLNPNTRGRDILFLAPLLSTLVGFYYWIVVRRYGARFMTLLHMFSWALIIAAIACMVYLLSPQGTFDFLSIITRDLSFKSDSLYIARALSELIAAIVAAVATIILCKMKKAVWIAMLSAFCSMMLIFWAIANPYKASDHSRSTLGKDFRVELATVASPDTVIYKDSAIAGLYSETYYMGFPVKTISSFNDIPESEMTVYVISARTPLVLARNWTKMLERTYKERRLYLWKGVLITEDYNDYYDDEDE